MAGCSRLCRSSIAHRRVLLDDLLGLTEANKVRCHRRQILSEGAKAQLRVFLDIAEMQAKGTPPQELKMIIQQRSLVSPTCWLRCYLVHLSIGNE